MGPTVHDVRGVPVPGLSGVRPPTRPAPVPFRDILRGATPAAPSTTPSATKPAATPARPSAAPPVQRPHAPGKTAASGGKHALAAAIRQAAGTTGVEPSLSVAVARAESALDPNARSSDGLSVGTFQLTGATTAEMRRKIAAGTVARVAGREDVALGVGYLRYLHDLFGRRTHLAPGRDTVPVADATERQRFAVAAFNAGEGRVAQAQARAAAAGGDPTRFADVRRFLPSTTQAYVQRVADLAREERGAVASAVG